MNDAAIVGKECSVATSDVDQRGGKTVLSGSVIASVFEVCPIGWFRATGITVATATRVACIDRAEAAARAILIGRFDIVVELVARAEP